MPLSRIRSGDGFGEFSSLFSGEALGDAALRGARCIKATAQKLCKQETVGRTFVAFCVILCLVLVDDNDYSLEGPMMQKITMR